MTPNPHADLRATIEFVEQARKIPMGSRDAAERGVVAKWLYHSPALVRALLEERDKLVEQIEDQDDAPEWLSAVDEALGEDRKKAPFIDDAVRLLRKERDALKAEVEKLRAAKPAEPIPDELHLRCMMAATLLGGMYADPNVHPGHPKHSGMIHDAVDALIAEARRRK